MTRKDAVPGGGATPDDAQSVLGSKDFATDLRSRKDRLRTEPILGEEFIARINLLRTKLFQDPSRVLSAEFHLRSDPESSDDDTILRYIPDPTNPDIWTMNLEDKERITPDRENGIRKISANFGVRLDANGNREGFAARTESLIGDSTWQRDLTIDEKIGRDLDIRLGQPKPPKRGGVAMMESIPKKDFPDDPSKTKAVVGRMSDYEGAVYLFGQEAADEMERKKKEESDAIQAKKDSMKVEHDILLLRKARIDGILNPNVFISFAELQLRDGIKLTIYNGDNIYPDLWRVSLSIDGPDEHDYHSIGFGFDTIPRPEWDDLAFKGPFVDSWILGVDSDPLKPVTGDVALSRLDDLLDAHFPMLEQ